MKLLFDQNLSPRLAGRLADLFPESAHVSHYELGNVEDVEVWDFARTNGFVVVTKDSDFSEICTMYGSPPKLLWLRIGNCTTRQIENLLRSSDEAIQQLESQEDSFILELR
jgi:predicted nuclease of predicted toxin-antitoxin system